MRVSILELILDALKSEKYCTNFFHSRAFCLEDERYTNEQMRKNRQEKRFIFTNGIEKL